MRTIRKILSRLGWPELLLAVACVALLFQVFTSLWFGLLVAIDVRSWSRGIWVTANIGAVLALSGVRFGPELYREWREWRARIAIKRDRRVKQQKFAEQREMLERMERARARRVY